MKGLRLILITRRFWPLIGGAETVIGNLAARWVDSGHQATILTARWQRNWPEQLRWGEVPVVRLANPRLRGWGTWRYMTAVARWLRAHRTEYDIVYVSMLKHDAWSAVHALCDESIPVVLRAEGAGATGDCQWQRNVWYGPRVRHWCRQAAAIVAPSDAIYRELLAAGYARPLVHQIPNGVAIPDLSAFPDPGELRNTLAESNSDFRHPANALWVVYTGRLVREKGLFDLIDAWTDVALKYPQARLFLVGGGPERESLIEYLRRKGLAEKVLLPGIFDRITDLLFAADLYILPSYQEGMSMGLLEAMSVGLPVIATDIEANRALIRDGEHGWLVPPADPPRLAAAIVRALSDPSQRRECSQHARIRVEQHYSIDHMVQGHVRLFEQLRAVARKSEILRQV